MDEINGIDNKFSLIKIYYILFVSLLRTKLRNMNKYEIKNFIKNSYISFLLSPFLINHSIDAICRHIIFK